MKRVVTLLLTACLYTASMQAQDTAPGYIISKGSDTTSCIIRLPLSLRAAFNEASLSEEVIVIDSAEKKHRYTPKDIAGFSFKYGAQTHRYVAKAINGNGKVFFVRVLVEGALMNCFQYNKVLRSNPTAAAGRNSVLGPGLSTAIQKFYILEDAEHRLFTLNEFSFADRGQKFKKFFAGKPEQSKLYDATVRNFVDVPYFAAVLNSK